MPAPTLAEVRKWPATCAVRDAARAMGCSGSQLYALIARGEAPVRVLSFGRRHSVVTASLVRLLEGE
jgi:hypothetical protein